MFSLLLVIYLVRKTAQRQLLIFHYYSTVMGSYIYVNVPTDMGSPVELDFPTDMGSHVYLDFPTAIAVAELTEATSRVKSKVAIHNLTEYGLMEDLEDLIDACHIGQSTCRRWFHNVVGWTGGRKMSDETPEKLEMKELMDKVLSSNKYLSWVYAFAEEELLRIMDLD